MTNAATYAHNGRKIVTSNIYPPIPIRTMDWCAYFDGEEELGGYGYGRTEAEAVADFIANLDEPFTRSELEAEIATKKAQLADWSLRFPMGDVEPEIEAEIAELETDLAILTEDDTVVSVAREAA